MKGGKVNSSSNSRSSSARKKEKVEISSQYATEASDVEEMNLWASLLGTPTFPGCIAASFPEALGRDKRCYVFADSLYNTAWRKTTTPMLE